MAKERKRLINEDLVQEVASHPGPRPQQPGRDNPAQVTRSIGILKQYVDKLC